MILISDRNNIININFLIEIIMNGGILYETGKVRSVCF